MKFIEKFNLSEPTTLYTASISSYTIVSIKAFKLTDTKICIIYSEGYSSSSSATQYIKAVIGNFKGDTIKLETPLILGETEYGSNLPHRPSPDAIVLNENKIIIFYGPSPYFRLVGDVCTINNSIITKETSTIISTDSFAGCRPRCVKLGENKIFIANSHYASSGGDYLDITLIEINNTTITILDQQLGIARGAYYIDIAKLSDASVIVTYLENNFIKGIVCSLGEDNKIITGTLTSILYDCEKYYSILALDNSSVFLTKSPYLGSTKDLDIGYLTINDKVITCVYDETLIDVNSAGGINTLLIKLNSNEVFIFYYHDGIKGIIYDVVNKEILKTIVINNIQFPETYIWLEDNINLFYTTSNKLYEVDLSTYNFAKGLTSITDEIGRHSKNIRQ